MIEQPCAPASKARLDRRSGGEAWSVETICACLTRIDRHSRLITLLDRDGFDDRAIRNALARVALLLGVTEAATAAEAKRKIEMLEYVVGRLRPSRRAPNAVDRMLSSAADHERGAWLIGTDDPSAFSGSDHTPSMAANRDREAWQLGNIDRSTSSAMCVPTGIGGGAPSFAVDVEVPTYEELDLYRSLPDGTARPLKLLAHLRKSLGQQVATVVDPTSDEAEGSWLACLRLGLIEKALLSGYSDESFEIKWRELDRIVDGLDDESLGPACRSMIAAAKQFDRASIAVEAAQGTS